MDQKKRKGFGVSDLLRNATGGADEPPASKNPSTENPAARQVPERRGAAKPEPESTSRKTPPEERISSDEQASSAEPSAELEAEGGHRKTTKGYVRADGTTRRRKSLFLEAHQISALEVLAMKRGYQGNVSAFVADELNLDAVADELGFTS